MPIPIISGSIFSLWSQYIISYTVFTNNELPRPPVFSLTSLFLTFLFCIFLSVYPLYFSLRINLLKWNCNHLKLRIPSVDKTPSHQDWLNRSSCLLWWSELSIKATLELNLSEPLGIRRRWQEGSWGHLKGREVLLTLPLGVFFRPQEFTSAERSHLPNNALRHIRD